MPVNEAIQNLDEVAPTNFEELPEHECALVAAALLGRLHSATTAPGWLCHISALLVETMHSRDTFL